MNRKLDYNNWYRRQAFEFFSNVSNPFYMVTFKLDVTKLYDYVKKHQLSFYYGLIWLCNKAINDLDDFLISFENDELVVLAQRNPSFTDLRKDSEQFYIVTMDFVDDIDEFCNTASALSARQECFIDMTKETDDLIYFSCLPWIDLTALTNERDLNNPKCKDDSIAHIAWGKYIDIDGTKTIGISLEVNHRFIDGIHIGKLVDRMNYHMNNL